MNPINILVVQRYMQPTKIEKIYSIFCNSQ